jgi:hypothetical protein
VGSLQRFTLIFGACVAIGAVIAAAAFAKAPNASTRPASAIGPHSAVVEASINPNDKPVTYSFEYGATTAYGSSTALGNLAKGKANVLVSATLTGLLPGTTYHFQVLATNADGTTPGGDLTFTTAADASAPEVTTPGSGDPGSTPIAPVPDQTPALPTPVLGQSVNVAATVGTVVVRLPGSARAVPVEATTSVPVGTLVDTRKGAVALTTAVPGGATQGAIVHGGLFQVRQPASGKGMTELVLRGPKPTCGARAAAATGRRPPRKLWSSDHGGRFRTRGSNAVATVRGTSWYMADRCDGTYTRVKHGKVAVRDLHSGRTFLLRAGQSHLAPNAR